jgi:hypothetical protein
MNRHLPFLALAISVMSNVFTPSLKAAEWDEKTIFTTSQAVAVQGTILPAGQYVLKLQDPASTRQVIAIFNSDQTRLLATVLSQPALASSRSMSRLQVRPQLCTPGFIRDTSAAMSFCSATNPGSEQHPEYPILKTTT